ncbi:MAG TPA: hypothetical protein VGG43_00640 [Acidimicrobiales bacterium]
MTVHLDSGSQVVIVEGRAYGPSADAEVMAEYNRKYDGSYDADTYGRPTVVVPETVLAWRTRGRAGRERFHQTGKWRLG